MTSAEDEVVELRRKLLLLEGDRRAYYETSQWTIKQNRETLATVKNESKALRADLASRHSLKSAASSDAAELERLASYVAELRKRFDDSFQLANQKESLLHEHADSVKELELDSMKLAEGDTPITQRIQSLQSRLAFAMERHEEVLAQRKTYEQILKRLREERTGLDPQLHALERTLAAKSRDLEELIRVSHEASHGKDAAKAALAGVEEELAAGRLLREKQLSDRRALWRIKQDLVSSIESMRERGADVDELGVDTDMPRPRPSVTDEGSRTSDETGGMSLDVALRKIKEATGVSDVDDVIKKFSAQTDTAKNLASMTEEAQARIDSLTARIDAAKTRVEELRYSGATQPSAGAVGGSRRAVDDQETRLVDALANQERLQQRQERVARLMVSVRAGAEHLAEQLEAVELPSEPPQRMHAADATSLLPICKLKLRHALFELRDEEAASQTALADPARLSELAFPVAEESCALLPTLQLEHLNALSDAADERDEEADEDAGGGGAGSAAGDVVTERLQLKARANAVSNGTRIVASAKKPRAGGAGRLMRGRLDD